MTTEQYDALDAELRALAQQVRFPATPDLAAGIRARIETGTTGRRTRWWEHSSAAAIAAGVVAILAVVLLVSPGAREAVASLYRGVRGIRIVVDQPVPTTGPTTVPTTVPPASSTTVPVSPSPPTPSPSAPSEPPSASPASPSAASPSSATAAPVIPGDVVTLEQAAAAVPFTPLLPPALGAPDRVHLEKDVARGMLTMVWRVTDELPVAEGDIGAVITQFAPGIGDDFPYWIKGVQSVTQLMPVEVNGSQGHWVEGGHRLDFQIPDDEGWRQIATSRIAANTLIWTQNGVTIRLESALDLDAVMKLAESMR